MALRVQMYQSIELLQHVNEEDLPLKLSKYLSTVVKAACGFQLGCRAPCVVQEADVRRQALMNSFLCRKSFFFYRSGTKTIKPSSSLPAVWPQCRHRRCHFHCIHTHTHTHTKERKTRNKIKFLEATKKGTRFKLDYSRPVGRPPARSLLPCVFTTLHRT